MALRLEGSNNSFKSPGNGVGSMEIEILLSFIFKESNSIFKKKTS
jgi:hypothetical protein